MPQRSADRTSVVASTQSKNYANFADPNGLNPDAPPSKMGVVYLAWDKFASRSVLIRSVPWACLSATIAMISRWVRYSENEAISWWSAAIGHPLAVQVFGIMFAFLITNRVTRAIGRWWDGLMTVTQMYVKWYDAFSFIMFNIKKEHKEMEIQSARTDLSVEDLEWVHCRVRQLEDFSHKMIHWFSLMNALALGTLKYGEGGCLQMVACKHTDFSWLSASDKTKLLGKSWTGVVCKMDLIKNAFVGGKEMTSSLMHLAPISKEERLLLDEVEDKMYLTVQWIMQALVIADGEKIIDIAPPNLNRVYMLVQDGVTAYLAAYKLAAVPYPYPLAQMMKMLMYAFVLLMPIIIETFTKSLMLTPLLSFLIILSYWGLNRVAKELENPFGEDANDLPLHDFCATFNDHIQQMSSLQVRQELDEVFTFSAMFAPGKNRMPSKKPASLSTPPKPAPKKVSDNVSSALEAAQKAPMPTSAESVAASSEVIEWLEVELDRPGYNHHQKSVKMGGGKHGPLEIYEENVLRANYPGYSPQGITNEALLQSQRILPADSVPEGARRRAPFAFSSGQNAQQQVAMPAQPHGSAGSEEDAYWAHLFLQRRMHIQARMECQRMTNVRQVAPGHTQAQSDPRFPAQPNGQAPSSPEPQSHPSEGRHGTKSEPEPQPSEGRAAEELC